MARFVAGVAHNRVETDIPEGAGVLDTETGQVFCFGPAGDAHSTDAARFAARSMSDGDIDPRVFIPEPDSWDSAANFGALDGAQEEA